MLRADLQRLSKSIASDAAAAKADEVKAVKAGNKERVDSEKQAAEASKQGWGLTEEGVLSATKAVGGFAAGLIGLNGASQAVEVVIDHFKQINKSVFEAGQFVQDYRKALLELAALKGQLGNTTQTLGQDIDFRSKTLQSKEDAVAFQNAALGVGESAIDKPGMPGLISRSEFTKAMEYGGAFQAAEGGDAATHANLVGMIPQMLGRRTTGAEVARKEAQLYKIFQPGGASFSSMSGQYGRLAPLAGNKTFDPMQLAALLSAFSTTNPTGAGDEVQQFTRATVGNIDRSGKPRVKGAEPIGDYYESLGVDKGFLKGTKSNELPFRIADKVAADVLRAEAAAKAAGEEFSRLVYLKHKGFANQEEVNSLSHYISLKESGTLQNQFMPLAADSAMPSLAEATDPTRRAQNTEPVLQARKAELAEEAAKVALGAGRQEYITNLQRVAFGSLKADKKVSGDYSEDLQNRWDIDPREILFGQREKVELESQRLLMEEARRVGVKTPHVPGTYSGGLRTGDQYLGNEAMYDLGRQIHAAGGTAVPGLEGVVGKAQKSLRGAAAFEGTDDAAGAAGGAPAADMTETNDLLRQLIKGVVPGAPRPLVPPNYVMRR